MKTLSIEDQIIAAIRRIIRAVDLHSRRLLDECGLTGPQLTTLGETARMGTTTVSALARAIHLSQPTVTGILDRLEKRGLIERVRDAGDRRAVNVSATVAGHQFLNRAPSLLQDRFRRELSKLYEWEQTQTLASLQRIAEMMGAETLDASPALTSGPVDPTGAAGERTPASPGAPRSPVGKDGGPVALPSADCSSEGQR